MSWRNDGGFDACEQSDCDGWLYLDRAGAMRCRHCGKVDSVPDDDADETEGGAE